MTTATTTNDLTTLTAKIISNIKRQYMTGIINEAEALGLLVSKLGITAEEADKLLVF
jgi:hypothetical protein